MKPQELFGLLVRLVGLVLILYGLRYLTVLATAQRPLVGLLLYVVLVFVIGAYFLRGAPRLLGWCYPTSQHTR